MELKSINISNQLPNDENITKDNSEEMKNNKENKELDNELKHLNDNIKINYKDDCFFKMSDENENSNKDNQNTNNRGNLKNNNINKHKDNNKKEENNNEINNKINKENSIIFSPILISNKKVVNIFNIPKDSKYGIDINGNPVEISELNKAKLIAFIVQKDNKDNYLIDIQGNILQKTEDDYYIYKNGEELIIIKDFDVQHAELRIYGHRKINFEEIKKNFCENITNDYKNKNESIVLNNETNKIDINTNISNIGESTPLNNNKNITRNRSVIIEKNSDNNKNKEINISEGINIGNKDFKNQMNLWRQRYGRNNDFIESKNYIKKDIKVGTSIRRYSFSKNNITNSSLSKEKNGLVDRTNSILKMASSIDINLPSNKSPPKYKKLSTTNKHNSYSNILNNISYHRHHSCININNNNYKKAKEIKNKKSKNNKRKKTLEYINNQYNNYTTDLICDLDNEEEKIKRANLLENIKSKYNYKLNNTNLIYKEESKDNEIKNQKIDDYIYSNLKKINVIKKYKQIKCEVLKTEVNQIITNFNKNQDNKKQSMTTNKIKDYNISETDEIPYNKKGEKLYFEYGNNETDIIYRKVKLIPSKIRQNKIEIYNNNFNMTSFTKVDKFSNNTYYRKIKHNKY